MNKEKKISFTQGFMCCLATMANAYGKESEVEEQLRHYGIKTIADLRSYGVAEYDIDALRPAIKFNKKYKGAASE